MHGKSSVERERERERERSLQIDPEVVRPKRYPKARFRMPNVVSEEIRSEFRRGSSREISSSRFCPLNRHPRSGLPNR